MLQIEEENMKPVANDNSCDCCSEDCMDQYPEPLDMPQMSMLERMAEHPVRYLNALFIIVLVVMIGVCLIAYGIRKHLGLS